MKWNTTPFTNIDRDVFLGRYNGVDFEVEPGQTIYLPTMVAQHICNQLVLDMDKKLGDKDIIPEYGKILGEEIITAEVNGKMSFAEQIKLHQKQFKEWQETEKKKNLLKKDKAIKIAEKND